MGGSLYEISDIFVSLCVKQKNNRTRAKNELVIESRVEKGKMFCITNNSQIYFLLKGDDKREK